MTATVIRINNGTATAGNPTVVNRSFLNWLTGVIRFQSNHNINDPPKIDPIAMPIPLTFAFSAMLTSFTPSRRFLDQTRPTIFAKLKVDVSPFRRGHFERAMFGSVLTSAHPRGFSSCSVEAHFENEIKKGSSLPLKKGGVDVRQTPNFGHQFSTAGVYRNFLTKYYLRPNPITNPATTPDGMPISRNKVQIPFHKEAVSFRESTLSCVSSTWFAGVFTSGCVFGRLLIISRLGSGIVLSTMPPISATRITPNALKMAAACNIVIGCNYSKLSYKIKFWVKN